MPRLCNGRGRLLRWSFEHRLLLAFAETTLTRLRRRLRQLSLEDSTLLRTRQHLLLRHKALLPAALRDRNVLRHKHLLLRQKALLPALLL